MMTIPLKRPQQCHSHRLTRTALQENHISIEEVSRQSVGNQTEKALQRLVCGQAYSPLLGVYTWPRVVPEVFAQYFEGHATKHLFPFTNSINIMADILIVVNGSF